MKTREQIVREKLEEDLKRQAELEELANRDKSLEDSMLAAS